MNDLTSVIKKGNQKKDLREIHLVGFLVRKITEDSAVIPKSSFYLDFNNNIRLERNFKLKREHAFQSNGYERFN